MSVGLSRFVDRFENLKLLVVGEAMLDSDLHGASTRLCPEAPAPGGGLIRELPSTARVLAPPATAQIAAGKTLALQPLNLETRQ